MFKSITLNTIAAVATAALAATLTIFLTPGAVPEAKAYPQVTPSLPAMVDSLPSNAKGNACSSRGWPHFEQGCLFDVRVPANDLRAKVRVIVLP
jgi:hypothetical protein